MHLLYLDDAGSVGNAREQHLVLGRVSVFEPQSSWITQALDSLAQNVAPEIPTVSSFTLRRPTPAAALRGRASLRTRREA